jgi:hypothetical protein
LASDRPSLEVLGHRFGSTCFPGSSKELFHTALQWGNLFKRPGAESSVPGRCVLKGWIANLSAWQADGLLEIKIRLPDFWKSNLPGQNRSVLHQLIPLF